MKPRLKVTIRERPDGKWDLKVTDHRPGQKPRLRYGSYGRRDLSDAICRLIDWQGGVIVV